MFGHDWNLNAVVNNNSSGASSFSSAGPSTPVNPLQDELHFTGANSLHGFQELYQQFMVFQPDAPPVAAYVVPPEAQSIQPQPRYVQMMQQPALPIPMINMNQMYQNMQVRNNPVIGAAALNPRPAAPQPNRRPRKQSQGKMVRQMTQEEVTADAWAWRKYGQKPIKGSPYPRNYYRCTTSKGCAARKHVERSQTDANSFVVSYAGEHTHPRPTYRCSLFGSSRNRVATGASNLNSAMRTNTINPPLPADMEMEEVEGGDDAMNDEDDEVFVDSVLQSPPSNTPADDSGNGGGHS